MKFELNKFYQHSAGRYIAIIGLVKTYAWGDMLVIEETDKTGHSISCITIDSEDTAENWIEVSETEWKSNFPTTG